MPTKTRLDVIKPSEKYLIRIWDEIDSTRAIRGEHEAAKLAAAAFLAVTAKRKD